MKVRCLLLLILVCVLWPLSLQAAIDLRVPLEMCDGGVSSATTTTTFNRCSTQFDPADYDGTITWRFEVDALNNDTSTRSVSLVDDAGTVLVSIPITASTATPRRYEDTFTPTTGTTIYIVRLDSTPTGLDLLQVFTARILVDQVGATKTRVQVPILQGPRVTVSHATTSGPVDATASLAYTQAQPDRWALWRRDNAVYADIASGTPWTFGAVLNSTAAAVTAWAGVFNATTGVQVVDGGTPVEVSVTSGAALVPQWVSIDFASDATNFTDTQIFEARFKNNTAGQSAQIFVAHLYVRLTNLTKAEMFFRASRGVQSSARDVFSEARLEWDSTKFSSVTTYLESTGRRSAGNALRQVQLFDFGASDSASTGSAITNPSIQYVGTTRARLRTGVVSLTDHDRYGYSSDTQTGTIIASNLFIVADAAGMAATATPTSTPTITSTPVVSLTPTRTPTVTLTPTLTPTPTPTSTVAFTPTVVPTATPTSVGAHLAIPLEMLDAGVTSDTSAVTFVRSRVWIDTADYDGSATYQWEINVNNAGAADDVVLVNGATSIATITVDVNVTDLPRRYRVNFTPVSGLASYDIKMPAGLNIVIVYSARVIVGQSAATVSRVQIPLLNGGGATASTVTTFATDSTSSTVATQQVADRYSIWRKTAGAYAALRGGTPWTLTAIVDGSGTGSTHLALFNRRTGNMVVGSELVSTAATPETLSVNLADNATEFTDDDEFEIRIWASVLSRTARVYSAYLYVRIGAPFTAIDVPYRVYRNRQSAAAEVLTHERIVWSASAYSGFTVTTALEATGRDFTSASPRTVQLWDAGTSDVDASGNVVSTAMIDPATTVKSRIRTGSIILTNGNRYAYASTCGTNCGTSQVSDLLLIASLAQAATPGPTDTPTHTYTAGPTFTVTPVPPTFTATRTPTATNTSVSGTATPTPTGPTVTPTHTPWNQQCTQWIGFSQVADVQKAVTVPGNYCFTDPAQLAFVPDDRVQLRWCNGCGVERWAIPEGQANSAWDSSCAEQAGPACAFSPCANLSLNPDRIVFVISDALTLPDLLTPDDYQPYLDGAIALIRAHYTNFSQIILQTVIGGPNAATCYCTGIGSCAATPVATPVRASVNYPTIVAAIAQWVAAHPAQPDVIVGYEPQMGDCNWYVDTTGHVVVADECPLATSMAAYYNPVSIVATPTRTGTPATPTWTPTPIATPTGATPTATAPPTNTLTRTSTSTPTRTLTQTSTPTSTRTDTPTSTATPTNTPTSSQPCSGPCPTLSIP